MEIKIQCGCGAKYKFDVEPANGRMPVIVTCPSCGNNGTEDANQQIAQRMPQPMRVHTPVASAPPAPTSGGLRLSSVGEALSTLALGVDPSAPGLPEDASASLLNRKTFVVKERVAAKA